MHADFYLTLVDFLGRTQGRHQTRGGVGIIVHIPGHTRTRRLAEYQSERTLTRTLRRAMEKLEEIHSRIAVAPKNHENNEVLNLVPLHTGPGLHRTRETLKLWSYVYYVHPLSWCYLLAIFYLEHSIDHVTQPAIYVY